MPSETDHVSDGISFAQPISFLLIYVKKNIIPLLTCKLVLYTT